MMGLKALAEMVLSGSPHNVVPIAPPRLDHKNSDIDLVDFIDAIEERAAIMEFDAPDCYPTRELATAAAYEDNKVIWLERYKNVQRN